MNAIVFVKSHKPEHGEMKLTLSERIETRDQGKVFVACEIIRLEKSPELIKMRRWVIEQGEPAEGIVTEVKGPKPHIYRLLKITLVNNVTGFQEGGRCSRSDEEAIGMTNLGPMAVIEK